MSVQSATTSPPGSPVRNPTAAQQRLVGKELTPDRGFTAVVRPMEDSPSRVVGARPDWCAKTHRLLRQLSEINRAEQINPDAVDEVRQIANHLIHEGNPNEMLHFLKMLSEFYFVGAKKIFFTVIAALREIEPAIEVYLKDVDTDEVDEGPVLSASGIGKIFELFENEFAYPSGILKPANVSELPQLIDEMINSPSSEIMRGWTIENDLMVEDPHVVPVFALKSGGRTHVFIFDSLGHTIDGQTIGISASLEELLKHFSDTENIDRHLSIYSYKPKRQNSVVGCGIFSIVDLKCLLERHIRGAGNLIDFYAAQEQEHRPRLVTQFLNASSRLPIYEIDILPPEMMKPTQSLQAIKAYVTDAPQLHSESVPRFPRYSATGNITQEEQSVRHVRRRIAHAERWGARGPGNFYMDQKRLKYTVYLLGLHLKEMKAMGRVQAPRGRVTRVLLRDDSDQEQKGAGRTMTGGVSRMNFDNLFGRQREPTPQRASTWIPPSLSAQKEMSGDGLAEAVSTDSVSDTDRSPTLGKRNHQSY